LAVRWRTSSRRRLTRRDDRATHALNAAGLEQGPLSGEAPMSALGAERTSGPPGREPPPPPSACPGLPPVVRVVLGQGRAAMSDVFISYGRSTARQARGAAEALRTLGCSVWHTAGGRSARQGEG
jgi:hypothetical protein